MERRLAAILIADAVGHSRLIEADEAGTLAALDERRAPILDPAVRKHVGRVVKTMGDGVLVEFKSAVQRSRLAELGIQCPRPWQPARPSHGIAAQRRR